MTGEAGGVVLVSQPGGQVGNETSRTDSLGKDIGVEEIVLNELAQSSGEFVLTLDDQRGVRNWQPQRPAEQSRHGEPVHHATYDGRLGTGLYVAKDDPVGTSRGH